MQRISVTMLSASALAFALTVACSGKQSYVEAITILCHAPHKAGLEKVAPEMREHTFSKWVGKRLTNERARSLFAEYENGSPWARRRLLRKAMRDTGITSCTLADFGSRLRPDLAAALAEVPATHFAELTGEAPRMLVAKREILVDGKKVLSLSNGVIEKDGDTDSGHGRIAAVTTALAGLTHPDTTHTTAKALVVYFDHEAPYQLVTRVLSSAVVAPASFTNIRLLVRSADATRALALSIPDLKAAAAPATPNDGGVRVPAPATAPASQPIRPVLSISRSQLALWSMSGAAGTLADPAFKTPVDPNRAKRPASFDAPAVSRALAKIIALHWKDKPRPAEDQRILVIASGDVPFHVVARAIAAAKGPANKPALFEGVTLGASIE